MAGSDSYGTQRRTGLNILSPTTAKRSSTPGHSPFPEPNPTGFHFHASRKNASPPGFPTSRPAITRSAVSSRSLPISLHSQALSNQGAVRSALQPKLLVVAVLLEELFECSTQQRLSSGQHIVNAQPSELLNLPSSPGSFTPRPFLSGCQSLPIQLFFWRRRMQSSFRTISG